MKTILGIIIFLIVFTVAIWLLPLVVAVFVAIAKFSAGNILGGIISIAIGILCEILWVWIFFNGDLPVGDNDGSCPYCGSGDTDGNHCYDCGDDF